MTEQDRIQKVQENVDEKMKTGLTGKINQYIYKSNGFLTKENGYLCKAEWHAVMIGVSFPAMAFMLPSPLGEFMIIAMLLMLRVGFKKLGGDLHGHMADVMHELAYMLVSAMLTVAFFTYFTGRKLQEIDVGSIIGKLLLGA